MSATNLPTIRAALPSKTNARECPTTSVGIDTIGVRGHLAKRPDFARFEHRNLADYDLSGDGFVSTAWTPLDGVRLGATSSGHDGPSAYWEISVPMAANGHNLYPLPCLEAMEVLRQIFELASGVVEWGVPFEDLSVSRLDTTRDFCGIEDIPEVLVALSHLPIPGQAQRDIWATSGGLHGISVQVASRWRAQFYDKQKQLAGLRPAVPDELTDAAQGVLRFECRTWRSVNRVKPFATIGGLSHEVLDAHNRHYFDLCQFGQEVTGFSKVQEGIARSLMESKSDDFARMLGHQHFIAQTGKGPYNPVTNAKYKKMAKELNISVADLMSAATRSLQLDHATGLLNVEGYGTSTDPKLEMAA